MVFINNPLNIRASKSFNWLGQCGARRGFCEFSTLRMGRRAGMYLLSRSYRRSGVTNLSEVIKRWAPSSENPTDSYIDFVSSWSGLPRSATLHLSSDYASVLAAMELFEQGVPSAIRKSYFEDARGIYLSLYNELNELKS